MKATELKALEEKMRAHMVYALEYLYKAASVGDNRLELGKHSICYSDGAEYTITAIEKMFGATASDDEMVYYQYEEDNESQTDSYPVGSLPFETLIDLLEAVETVVDWVYDGPL